MTEKIKIRCIDDRGSAGALIYDQTYIVEDTIPVFYIIDGDKWRKNRFEIVEEEKKMEFIVGNKYTNKNNPGSEYFCVGYNSNNRPVIESLHGVKRVFVVQEPDLYLPVPETCTKYLNIYENHISFNLRNTRKEADENSGPDRIACVKISFKRGQFDE